MCGAFTQSHDISALPLPMAVQWPTLDDQFGLRPHDAVWTVRATAPDAAEAVHLKWWLVPYWSTDGTMTYPTFNARSETAHEKPSFREPFKRRRCLIPMSGFYERAPRPGAAKKQPFYVRMRDGAPFAAAGLWDRWQGDDGRTLESCTMLTTEGNALLAALPHPRMPVILPPDAWGLWLDPEEDRVEVLREVLQPFPAAAMEAWPVSTAINYRDRQGSALCEPTGETVQVET